MILWATITFPNNDLNFHDFEGECIYGATTIQLSKSIGSVRWRKTGKLLIIFFSCNPRKDDH